MNASEQIIDVKPERAALPAPKPKRKAKVPYIGLVEIARSYAFKVNLGNYQSADFFCSQKSQCAVKDADVVSQALFDFCKRDVLRAVAQIKDEHAEVLNGGK